MTVNENSNENVGAAAPAPENGKSNGSYSQAKNHNSAPYSVGSDDFILVDEVVPRENISMKETINSILAGTWNKAKTSCNKKNLYKRLPILHWIRSYSWQDALGDFVAGITVGLMVIPQSLAYANIAGLPSQYGLYGSFLGALFYVFLGSCKDVPMGPTAITSLLTYQTLQGSSRAGHVASNAVRAEYACLLCLLSGIVQLFMGLAGLGIIIDFVSGPVSSGFTSAVALLIVFSQLKDIFGVNGKGTTFPQMVVNLYENLPEIRWSDTILGISCIGILLLMRLLSDVRVGNGTNGEKFANKIFWIVGTSRNTILVLICGIVGYLYSDEELFKYIGNIPPGLPKFEMPHLQANNGTLGFLEIIADMGSGIIVLPVIGLLENIAICKAFAHGKPVDATQELIAVGLCNIANSMVQSYPGTGSLSRSAVNNSSGVRTPLGGLYTGLLVIISLLFLTPYFQYIPKASLAAVIIAAVVFMVEVRVVKPIYRSKKSDLIPGIATFVACLVLPLEIGILVGIGLNLISILYHAARPKISIEIHKTRAGIEYLLITPDRCLIFPSVDYVRNLVTKHSMKKGIPVVIDCSHIYGADFTAAKVIEVLTKDFSTRNQGLYFYNLKPSIAAIFEAVQPKDFFTYYDKHDLDNLLRHRCVSSNSSSNSPSYVMAASTSFTTKF